MSLPILLESRRLPDGHMSHTRESQFPIRPSSCPAQADQIRISVPKDMHVAEQESAGLRHDSLRRGRLVQPPRRPTDRWLVRPRFLPGSKRAFECQILETNLDIVLASQAGLIHRSSLRRPARGRRHARSPECNRWLRLQRSAASANVLSYRSSPKLNDLLCDSLDGPSFWDPCQREFAGWAYSRGVVPPRLLRGVAMVGRPTRRKFHASWVWRTAEGLG
jgi:hypothetical protein